MKRFLILTVLLVLPVMAVYGAADPANIHKQFDASLGNLNANFTFAMLPEPLQPCMVKYHIEVIDTHRPAEPYTKLYINYSKEDALILSDTIITLPKPIAPGNVYDGTIRFAPQSSAFHYIYLSTLPPEEGGKQMSGLNIGWCFDSTGTLQYLGNQKKQPYSGRHVLTQFFTPDSLVLYNNYGSIMFQSSVLFSPTPKAGQTSEVTYTMKALEDLPEGVDFIISTTNMEVASLPAPLPKSLKKGDEFEISFGVIPAEKYPAQRLNLVVSQGSRGGQLNGYFIFDDNGNLKFASKRDPVKATKTKFNRRLNSGPNQSFRRSVNLYSDGREPYGWKKPE